MDKEKLKKELKLLLIKILFTIIATIIFIIVCIWGLKKFSQITQETVESYISEQTSETTTQDV